MRIGPNYVGVTAFAPILAFRQAGMGHQRDRKRCTRHCDRERSAGGVRPLLHGAHKRRRYGRIDDPGWERGVRVLPSRGLTIAGGRVSDSGCEDLYVGAVETAGGEEGEVALVLGSKR